jgi:hypothetical protein
MIPEGHDLFRALNKLAKRNDLKGIRFLLEHRSKRSLLDDDVKRRIGYTITDALLGNQTEIMWTLHDAFNIPIKLPSSGYRLYSITLIDRDQLEVTMDNGPPEYEGSYVTTKFDKIMFSGDLTRSAYDTDDLPGGILLERTLDQDTYSSSIDFSNLYCPSNSLISSGEADMGMTQWMRRVVPIY